MATGAAQAGGSFRILAGIAALSDRAGMISVDGGGTAVSYTHLTLPTKA